MPSSTSLGPLIPWLNARRTLLATLVIGTSVVGCMVMANVVANLALGWRIVMLVLFGLEELPDMFSAALRYMLGIFTPP